MSKETLKKNADGQNVNRDWTKASRPMWDENNEFRIKPQPKQPKYLYAYYRDKVYFLQDKDASNRYYIGKIEVQE